MALNIFLYLPDQEDGNIDFCNDTEAYALFMNQVASFITRVRKEVETNLYYDSENVASFFSMSEYFLGAKYLANPKEQMRSLLGAKSTNVRTNFESAKGALYFWWHYYHNPPIASVSGVLAEITERYLHYPKEQFLLYNMTDKEPCRQEFLLFRDNIKEYPSNFVRIPFVTDTDELELWIKTNHEQDFSLFNKNRFKRVGRVVQGKPVFQEFITGQFWYLDNFHKNEYEVFNERKEHIGTANLKGVLNTDNAENKRTLSI